MPARKMRVEVYDETGNRYTITFDGRVTRDKAIRLFDIIELLGGIPEVEAANEQVYEMSKIDKVMLIIKKHFPVMWFSSKDIITMYEREYMEPINLSTVSTYLSRMVNRGFLTKVGNRNSRRFRIMTEIIRLSKLAS